MTRSQRRRIRLPSCTGAGPLSAPIRDGLASVLSSVDKRSLWPWQQHLQGRANTWCLPRSMRRCLHQGLLAKPSTSTSTSSVIGRHRAIAACAFDSAGSFSPTCRSSCSPRRRSRPRIRLGRLDRPTPCFSQHRCSSESGVSRCSMFATPPAATEGRDCIRCGREHGTRGARG